MVGNSNSVPTTRFQGKGKGRQEPGCSGRILSYITKLIRHYISSVLPTVVGVGHFGHHYSQLATIDWHMTPPVTPFWVTTSSTLGRTMHKNTLNNRLTTKLLNQVAWIIVSSPDPTHKTGKALLAFLDSAIHTCTNTFGCAESAMHACTNSFS